jgi:thymidylate kinase
VALDGNDGSGKTTLAKRIASELKGEYLRPFSGSEGEQMLQSAERGDFDLALRIAHRLVEETLKKSQKSQLLIFDRLWMTVFTLVPEKYWNDWQPLQPTILCWADIDTTMSRLKERNEKVMHGKEYHLSYMEKYQTIAKRYSCPILHTDQMTLGECVTILKEWIASMY